MDSNLFRRIMTIRGIRPGARLVMLLLADLCLDPSAPRARWVKVSLNVLARECGITDSALKRHLEDLEKRGLIVREGKPARWDYFTPTSYSVVFNGDEP